MKNYESRIDKIEKAIQYFKDESEDMHAFSVHNKEMTDEEIVKALEAHGIILFK
jgi:molecular chaperone GrpE (heat shock protein)